MVQHPTDKQFSWTLRTGAFSAFILTVRRAVRKGHAMSIRRNIQEEVKKKKRKASRKFAFKHKDLTSVHARKAELLKLSSKYITIANTRKHTIEVEPVTENRDYYQGRQKPHRSSSEKRASKTEASQS